MGKNPFKIQRACKKISSRRKSRSRFNRKHYKSYKSKSQQSRAMFLLSSQNFYQAYKRLEYIKQYASFRKKQGEDIVIQTDFIENIKEKQGKLF